MLIKVKDSEKSRAFQAYREHAAREANRRSERLQEAKESLREERRERLKGNADYQRRAAMTKDERRRDAQERVTVNMYEHLRRTEGESATFEQAHKEVQTLLEQRGREVDK